MSAQTTQPAQPAQPTKPINYTESTTQPKSNSQPTQPTTNTAGQNQSTDKKDAKDSKENKENKDQKELNDSQKLHRELHAHLSQPKCATVIETRRFITQFHAILNKDKTIIFDFETPLSTGTSSLRNLMVSQHIYLMQDYQSFRHRIKLDEKALLQKLPQMLSQYANPTELAEKLKKKTAQYLEQKVKIEQEKADALRKFETFFHGVYSNPIKSQDPILSEMILKVGAPTIMGMTKPSTHLEVAYRLLVARFWHYSVLTQKQSSSNTEIEKIRKSLLEELKSLLTQHYNKYYEWYRRFIPETLFPLAGTGKESPQFKEPILQFKRFAQGQIISLTGQLQDYFATLDPETATPLSNSFKVQVHKLEQQYACSKSDLQSMQGFDNNFDLICAIEDLVIKPQWKMPELEREHATQHASKELDAGIAKTSKLPLHEDFKAEARSALEMLFSFTDTRDPGIAALAQKMSAVFGTNSNSSSAVPSQQQVAEQDKQQAQSLRNAAIAQQRAENQQQTATLTLLRQAQEQKAKEEKEAKAKWEASQKNLLDLIKTLSGGQTSTLIKLLTEANETNKTLNKGTVVALMTALKCNISTKKGHKPTLFDQSVTIHWVHKQKLLDPESRKSLREAFQHFGITKAVVESLIKGNKQERKSS